MSTRMLLWPPALCVALALALPATGFANPSVVSKSPAPAPSPAQAPTGVTLEQVDGGPGWYGRFANPLPTDPGYFPIGVWLQSVHTRAHINNDRDFGINTYVGVSDPEGTDKALMRANGMKALIQADERTRFTGIGHQWKGSLLVGIMACNIDVQKSHFRIVEC